MAIEHVDIVDPNIHEPKGVATANKGEAYVADGAGSGDWSAIPLAQAACLKMSTTGDTTGITAAYQAMNVANLGGTLAITENTNLDMTTDTTNGYIQVTDAGTYRLAFTGNIEPATNGSIFQFTFGVDSGSGIVTKEAFAVTELRTSGTSDTWAVALNCLPTLAALDKVYIMVLESSAGEEFELISANFTLERVG